MFRYADYCGVKFTPLQFIKLANENIDYFTNYLEIIIDDNGYIYLATPSHTEALIKLAESQHNFCDEIGHQYLITEYIISKYNYIAVWYNGIVASGLSDSSGRPFTELLSPESADSILKTLKTINKKQLRTLKILHNSGLLAKNYQIKYTCEYQTSLMFSILQ